MPTEEIQEARAQLALTRKELVQRIRIELKTIQKGLADSMSECLGSIADRYTMPKVELGRRLARLHQVLKGARNSSLREVIQLANRVPNEADQYVEETLLNAIEQAMHALDDIATMLDETMKSNLASCPSGAVAETRSAQSTISAARKSLEELKQAPWSTAS